MSRAKLMATCTCVHFHCLSCLLKA